VINGLVAWTECQVNSYIQNISSILNTKTR
jgi:hypothetical protein